MKPGIMNLTSREVANLLFYPLLVCSLIASTYATYYGLLPTAKQLVWPFTAIIVIMLFGSTLMFHVRYKEEHPRIAGPLAMLAVGLIFSTASNVNFFYNNYLEADQARTTYQQALESFRTDIDEATGVLRSDKQLAEADAFKIEIEGYLRNLEAQVNDPLRPGAGANAQRIMADIKRKLPALTDLALPPLSANDAARHAWYSRYEKLVNDNLDGTLSGSQKEYLSLVDQMNADDKAYIATGETLKLALATGESRLLTNNIDLVRTTLEEMAQKLVKYRTTVNRLIAPNSKPWNPSRLIDPEAARLGDVVRTWGFVLAGHGDPRALFWSALCSLTIDLAPILYSILVVWWFREGIIRPGGTQRNTVVVRT